MNVHSKLLLISILISLFPIAAFSQYFGRNKVQYEDFDFKVMETKNFRIYYYPSESEAIHDAARMLERWNVRFAQVLNHRLERTQPVIIYANHADFQQTNVVSGIISQGTGGVTEGMKNRIVLPLTGVYKNNDHVLGHELVHAFQFDIMKSQSQKTRLSSPQFPLWFIEGMAEFLSLGHHNHLTDMWIRDAVLHDDIPEIGDVGRKAKYFPYRWGHAIWEYIGNKWGDKIVATLYREVLYKGWNKGFENILGMKVDSLSKEWNASIKETYQPQIADRTAPKDIGKKLLKEDSDFNLAPVISPDGKYVAFLSRRNIFTIDLYLADARTGEVIRKLVSSNTDAHFDAMRFMDSAGSFSPDGKKFAFVVIQNGDNSIAILNVETKDIEQKIQIEGVTSIMDLAWSPDGQSIALTGLKGGISDLYLYNLNTRTSRQLTDDRYAEIQPSWSSDGARLVFATDRGEGTNLNNLAFGPVKIALLNLQSNEIQLISMPNATKHINPHFSHDGQNLFFIADPDGFSDIYRYSFKTREFSRITRIATGISGLTELSPAMSMARTTGQLVFTVFDDTEYHIYSIQTDTARTFTASPFARRTRSLSFTDEYLSNPNMGLPGDTTYSHHDYHPSLKLLAVGQPTIGVAVDRFGASLGGSVSLLFGDMLGNHILGVAAQANGGFKDLGGQALYLNQKHRFNYGASVGHIPYLTAQLFTGIDTVTVNGQKFLGRSQELILQRVFIDRISLISEYPLSTNRRFEFSTGYTRLSYSVQSDRIVTVGNTIVEQETRDLNAPKALNLSQSSFAYVGDYSFFGFTSPVNGRRYRLEVEPTFGSLQFLTVLADYRQYFFLNPITLAFRAYHNGRYLSDAENRRLTPLYAGYETLVRGYDIGSFDLSECSDPNQTGACPEIDRLIGSRIAVGNAEIRLPLFGTEQFGLINFPYLPTELAAFFDAGVAWTDNSSPQFEFDTKSTKRIPVFSTGVAARVNLLGYLVMQFYYAFPFQRPEKKSGIYGFVIAPGW